MAEDYGFDSAFEDVDSYSEEYDEGAEEQETAEPAEEEEYDIGAEEQEVAEPAEEEAEQSAEENARYAAARRKAEAERDAAIAEAQAEMENRIVSMGIVNPYTGEPVEDMEGFERYTAALVEDKRKAAEEKMKDAGLTENEIDQLVTVHPDVIKAREERIKLEQLERRQQELRYDQIIEDEIAKIHEMDPSINSFDDLQKIENLAEMEDMIHRGYNISDAFFLANKEAIMAQRISGAKQETRNSLAGRGHLEHTATRGSGGVDIPSDELAAFREMMPKASVAEIQKFYERDLKRTKKK